MKKKILAALAAVSVVTALVPVTSAFAAEEYTIIVHYDRVDMDDWKVWKWDSAGNGKAVEFEDGVATWTTSDTVGSAFIVAKIDATGKWVDRENGDKKPITTLEDGSKDGGDRSIDFTKAVDGVVDITVVPGSTTNEYAMPAEDPDESAEEPVESEEEPVESTEEPVESTEEPVESTEEPVESTDDPVDNPSENNTLTLKFKLDSEDADSYAIKYWGFGTFGTEKYAAFENGEAIVTWAEDEIAEGEKIGFGLALADESAEDRWVCNITMTPDVSEFNFGDTAAVVLSVSTDEDGKTVATAEATLVEGGNNGDNSDAPAGDSDAPAGDSDAPAGDSDTDGNNSNTSVADSDTDGKGNNSETGIALAVAPVVLAAGAVAAVVVVSKKRK